VPIHHHITVVNKLHLFVHRDRTEWLYHLELAPTISTVTVEEPVYDKVWKLISSTSDFWASPTIVHEESNQRPIFARLININLRPMAQDDVCFATFSEFFGGHFSHYIVNIEWSVTERAGRASENLAPGATASIIFVNRSRVYASFFFFLIILLRIYGSPFPSETQVTRPSIRRLARRGGVKRISAG